MGSPSKDDSVSSAGAGDEARGDKAPDGNEALMDTAGALTSWNSDSEGSVASMTEQSAVGVAEDPDEDVCPVCLDEVPNVQLRRCSHRLCLGCAKDLCKRHNLTPALCPCCRSVITGFILAQA